MKKGIAWMLALLVLLSANVAGAENGAVYEIFVSSFFDADGDGMGDLRGVAEKLDYLAALGVDAVWLMPISPSPSYHRYDVTDYRSVAPELGSMADFSALAAATDARGMEVYLDLVLNHTSNLHPWFVEAVRALKGDETADARYIEYYHFTQDGSGRKGYERLAGTEYFYEAQFGAHMPDLNLDSAAVREEIAAVVRFWLEAGADGFRLDAALHYYDGDTSRNNEFLSWLRQTVDTVKPGAYLVAEVWAGQSTIQDTYASGVNALFDFPLAGATGVLVSDLREGKGRALAKTTAAWQESVRAMGEDTSCAPFLTNHDMARIAGALAADLQKEKLAAFLCLTMPGRPFLYYGEEIGMTGSGRDENARLPMVWSLTDETGMCLPPADADQSTRVSGGVAEQEADENSLLCFYRQVLALRGQYAAFYRGAAQVIDTGDPAVMAYTLTAATDQVLLTANFSATDSKVLPLPDGAWQVTGFDTGSGAAHVQDGEIILPPLSGAIAAIRQETGGDD